MLADRHSATPVERGKPLRALKVAGSERAATGHGWLYCPVPESSGRRRYRRELGLSRKVVWKVTRSGATEFRYEREVRPFPRIGAWKAALDELLAANEQKPSRERLTLDPHI
jgi:hypothetical protein